MIKLVIEYHYKDRDIGAYEAEEGTEQCCDMLWSMFDTADVNGGKGPSHIIIRPAKEGE